MNNLFVTGIWAVNAKYSYRGYINMLPRVINMLDNVLSRQETTYNTFAIGVSKQGEQRLKDHVLWKRHAKKWEQRLDIKIINMELEDLPEIPSVSAPCGLKLGWRLPPEKMNGLNRVWCNKLWLMDTFNNQFGGGLDNVMWVDGGLKMFHRNFPRNAYQHFGNIQPDVMYSNRYGQDTIGGPRRVSPQLPVNRGGIPGGRALIPTRGHKNPYNVRHARCNYPHFIRAGVLACRAESVKLFEQLFQDNLEIVSSECGSFDEETVLSSMFINNPEKFLRWNALLPET